MIHAYATQQAGQALAPYTYEPGQLGDQEVEIQVDYCGICHSDISMIDNAWGMSNYPLVPGHEIIGTIRAVGKQVHGLSQGQTVGVGWHAGYCENCQQCRKGDHNLCAQPQATIAGHHGGFADTVRAEASSVVPLPEGMDKASAAPLLCGGITVFNPLLQFDIKPTDHVAIIGLGGLGHMALLFLKAWGCNITVFTTQAEKKAFAQTHGASEVIDTSDEAAISQSKHTFDFILSTVNVPLNWELYLNRLKPRGRLHIVGAVVEPIPINAFQLIMGQKQLSGSPVGSPENIKTMLEFAHRHAIKPTIETFPMAKVNDALDHLRAGKARYRIVLSNL